MLQHFHPQLPKKESKDYFVKTDRAIENEIHSLEGATKPIKQTIKKWTCDKRITVFAYAVIIVTVDKDYNWI